MVRIRRRCRCCLCGSAEEAKSSFDRHIAAQIDWIRSQGGLVSPKLEVRRLSEDDDDASTSPSAPVSSGVFTNDSVTKGEVIMVIPKTCLLTSSMKQGESIQKSKPCGTLRNLLHQRTLEVRSPYDSPFGPYVNFVFDPMHSGMLPSSWSDEGRALLDDIVGHHHELFPDLGLTDLYYHEKCKGNIAADDKDGMAATAFARRAFDDVLVPLYELVNHRNGKWTNVDASVRGGEDVTVKAIRDIEAGEQLYLSHNECDDCAKSDARNYVLPHILRDLGYVEGYPRRWNIVGGDYIFELDQSSADADDGKKGGKGRERLAVKWLSPKLAGKNDMHYLHGHLKRLKDMSKDVRARADKLGSNHERSTTIEFYDALIEALEEAIWSMSPEYDEPREVCTAADDPQSCSATSSSSRDYDDLKEGPYEVKFSWAIVDYDRVGTGKLDYEKIDKSKSSYQSIVLYHSDSLDDTCLHMNNHQHACASLRSHYHEPLVHYGAGFVEEVKRVVFIGGGDNFIIPEVLKYPTVELVLGLELDQKVLRKSFQYFDTLPYWDDDRVEWWFGDAVKSLGALPSDYFGSFDLVLVDLTNEVVGFLDIMNDTKRLAAPEGIIVRNEDGGFGSNGGSSWAKYVVDMYFNDVPHWGHQGLTLGSDSVDFLTKKWKDHGIETLVMEPNHGERPSFERWYNYRLSENAGTKESGTEDKKEKSKSSIGVLMVLEAEDAQTDLLESSASVQAKISAALKAAGLAEIAVQRTTGDVDVEEGKNDDRPYAMAFVLREGYVVARVFPAHRYCAFDILLWSNLDRQDAARAELIEAVGSRVAGKSSSSFRLITGGMHGVAAEKEETVPDTPTSSEQRPEVPARRSTASELDARQIYLESMALVQEKEAPVAVFCGEEGTPCEALDALAEKEDAVGGERAVPVWTCTSLAAETQQQMIGCEIDVLRRLRSLVEAGGRIGAIVIDSKVPRAIGQIVHKVLAGGRLRKELLTDDYVVMTATSDPSESSWRRALLDQFRTKFAIYNPAFASNVVFNSTDSSLELGLFSAGDPLFYSRLVDIIDKIETQTGLVSQVQYVKNGLNNYVAEFEPKHTLTLGHYKSSSHREQMLSQHPMGMQTFFQLDNSAGDLRLSTSRVKEALHMAILTLKKNNARDAEVREYTDVGDGCVVVAFWSKGMAFATWDGRNRVDVNLFTYEESAKMHAKLVDSFTKELPSLVPVAYDEMPRGFGRVVNFSRDIPASA